MSFLLDIEPIHFAECVRVEYQCVSNLNELNLAPFTVTIRAKGNRIHDLKSVVFPEFLTSLDVSQNKIQSLEGVRWTSLVHLECQSNHISSLEGVVFPPTLNTIRLGSNNLRHLNGVTFPRNLEVLELDRNRIATIAGVVFPHGLKTLRLTSNCLVQTRGAVFPPLLNSLFLQGNRRLVFETLELNSNLRRLNIARCGLKSLTRIDLPPSLHLLDVSENSVDGLDGAELPLRLTTLIANRNNLQEVPVRLPAVLKTLSLSHNKIKTLRGAQLPNTIERLDVSHNLLQDMIGVVLPAFVSFLYLDGNDGIKKLASGTRYPESLQRLVLKPNIHLTDITDVLRSNVSKKAVIF